MGIQLGSNFSVNASLPLDDRTVFADTTARDALIAGRRYEGLLVYVQADTTAYRLVGGITNGDWVDASASGVQNNFAGGVAPLVTDDNTGGYEVGSVWIFGTLRYFCTDASTGAAVWLRIVREDSLGDVLISNDLVVTGDFTVNGTTTNVNTTDLEVTDKNITVNNGGNDTSSEGAGVTVQRTGTDGSIVYEDGLTSKWKAGALGSEVEVADVSSAQTFNNKTLTNPVINNTGVFQETVTPLNPVAASHKLYFKSDSRMYQLNSSGNEKPLLIAGSAADHEAATSNDVAVIPSLMQRHPSAVNVWINYNGATNAIIASYNVTSITDNGVGNHTINLTTAFSSTNYSVVASCNEPGGVGHMACGTGYVTTSFNVRVFKHDNSNIDTEFTTAMAIGDQ